MTYGKVVLAIVGATVLLGALVGAASAAKLSTSSMGLRAAFATVRFAGGFGTTECAVTMEGSFDERSIQKNIGHLAGLVTRSVLGTCSRGSATLLAATLPWHIRYASFSGTLPNITRVNATIAGIAFQIREPVFGLTCLASGGTQSLIFNREASGALTTAEIGGTSPSSCGVEGTFTGTSNAFTVLGAAARITITLI